MQYDDVITNPIWRTDAILKVIFFAISQRYIRSINAKFWNRDEGSHADILCHVTKAAIFANSVWRTAAILKIALFPYLSRELSDVDQIRSFDEHSNSRDGHLTKKIEILQIQDGGRTSY